MTMYLRQLWGSHVNIESLITYYNNKGKTMSQALSSEQPLFIQENDGGMADDTINAINVDPSEVEKI